MTQINPKRPVLAYVGSPLPQRSQTFVYREMLGLRGRGWTIYSVSVLTPESPADDPVMVSLAAETTTVYSAATVLALAPAALTRPCAFAQAVKDAATADLSGAKARAKFLGQAWLGLATSWRLRGAGIGHVHAHLANNPATVGLYLARGLGASFSFTGHANDLFVQRGALAFKLRAAKFTASISHWHQRFYEEVQPGDVADRPVIRCSVTIPPTVVEGGEDIVALGRLVPKKGFDLLIRAYARMQAAGDLRLKIAGDGPERDALKALAAELGVADRVDFLGAVPHVKSLKLIAAAAIFALPCRTSSSGDRDGIPVVLMEALAAGRASVAGRLESIAELVEDEVGGLLVPPDDVDALAAALDRLAADPALRTRLGLAGRAQVEREFSDASNWDRLERALDRATT